MATYVALLRGINVGGSAKVPMPALRAAFADFGARDVKTYIQSGNVVFAHPARDQAKLETDVECMVEAHTGLRIVVMLRSTAQMTSAVANNPYPDASGTTLHVLFLKEPLDKAALANLDLGRFAPEEMTVVGREIYLHLPDGMGRAKLPVELGKLKAPATARNWNTVTKLLAMMT